MAEGRLNTKGQAVVSRSKTGRGKVTAPIFLLVPQVKLPKRLDLARDAEWALDSVPGLIVVKRLRVQGFIVMDYYDQAMKAVAELQGWVASGKLKVQEDVLEGIENTPKALIGLLNGDNRGKRMVRVS